MTELESEIRTRYDIEGFTARHPQSEIFRWINDAFRDFKGRVTADGANTFLTVYESTCTATGPNVSGIPGTVLADSLGLFSVFVAVQEVHAKIGSSWVPLKQIEMLDALTDTDLSFNCPPNSWFLAGVNRIYESTPPTETGQGMRIAVSPPNDVQRLFRVLGVVQTPDMVATDRIFTDLGIHEYAICWCGVQLANRDDDVNLWQGRMATLQACYADLLRRLKNATRGRASRVDTRTRGRLWPR